jgi:selenocysteine lyase/cysteine desulfurase
MDYTWMRISDGKRLMTRSENQGRTTIAFCSELNSGINTISNYKERVMYPNPVEKGGVLRFTTENLSQHSTFRLFDTQGRLVWQQNIINNSINLKNDLHAGIYFYIISDDDKQIHGKIEIN